jgi:hypothetical protein
MVVQELKTKFEHGKFLGAISIVFKDCQEILTSIMMMLSASLPIGAASSLGLLTAYKSVYQEKHKEKVW